MNANRRNEAGFTLIEMVIAMVVLSLVIIAFYALITTLTRQWAGMEGQMEVQQQPRLAAGRIVAEIRQARDFVVGSCASPPCSSGNSLGLVKATVLSADAAAAATTICVDDTSSLASGKPIVLVNVTSYEQVTASSFSGSCGTGSPVTVSALSSAHKQGELIRRAQSALSANALSASTTLSVTSASTYFQANDSVAVGSEGPFTVSAASGTTLTITHALASNHSYGDVVQPPSVVSKLVGTQANRCTHDWSTNGIVLADAANPSGLQLFSVVQSTLASSAAVGASSLCVVSATGFAANNRLQVDRETYNAGLVTLPDRATISSVSGACAGGTTVAIHWDWTNASRPSGTMVRVNAISVNLMTSQVNANQQTQQVNVTSTATPRN